MWQAEAVISRHGALGEIREAPDGSCHLWGMLEIVRHPLFSSQPFDYVCFFCQSLLQTSRNLVLPRSKTRGTISGVKSPSCPATQHLPPAIQKTSKPLQIPSSNLASTSSHILPAWPTYRQPTVLCSTEPTESSTSVHICRLRRTSVQDPPPPSSHVHRSIIRSYLGVTPTSAFATPLLQSHIPQLLDQPLQLSINQELDSSDQINSQPRVLYSAVQ